MAVSKKIEILSRELSLGDTSVVPELYRELIREGLLSFLEAPLASYFGDLLIGDLFLFEGGLFSKIDSDTALCNSEPQRFLRYSRVQLP